MAIQFESSIEVVGSASVFGDAYVESLSISNSSGQISNKIWFDTGGSPIPGLYFEGGQPKFIIYSLVQSIFHDGYHPNADTWTTARTITIGNTGKSVNGSANVSWSLAEIGAISGSGTVNYLARWTPNNDTLGIGVTYDNGTNVGIGTTSPGEKLTVKGTDQYIAVEQTNYPWGATNTLGLRMGTNGVSGLLDWRRWTGSGTNHGTAVIAQVNSDGGYGLDFRVDNQSTNTPATTSRMFLSSSGEVGIGTTFPGSKLEVAGNSASALLTLKSENGGTNDAFMRFYDESNGPSYSMGLDSSDQKFKIAYNSDGNSLTTGTKLVMETSGNVAIGATTAIEKLVVSGNSWITNNVYVGLGNTLKSCTYTAQHSLVVGQSNTLGGIANGIIGVSNTIDCTNEPWSLFGGNFIAGKNNTINNLYSHANAVFGQSNTVGDPTTSSNSVAGILVSGVGHSTFGDNSFAFGESCFTDINAKRSLTGGFDCNNFGYYGSVAIGAGATASTGNNQYAFGTGVTTPTSASAAYDSNQFVVGKFNVYSTGGRAHRFAVGNGFSDGLRSNALNVDTFGRTGLGVTAPSYQLQLSSNSAAKPTSSSWTVVSDERVKTNIQDYTTGLTEILQINPKTFDYNGKAGFEETTGNIGIIAQDVQGIMPETINTYEAKLNEDDAEETELFNFDSHPIQFALINAVKELNAKIEALEAKIQTLEGN